MSRAPETGETSASIIARGDDAAWRMILADANKGANIRRVPKLRLSYSDFGAGPQSGGISDTRLRKLESDGVIHNIGVDLYALAAGAK